MKFDQKQQKRGKILGFTVTSSDFLKSKTKEQPKLLSPSAMRGGKFISVHKFSVEEHASCENRHILNLRVMAVLDIKL